jgi:hypothetical protein
LTLLRRVQMYFGPIERQLGFSPFVGFQKKKGKVKK